MAQIRSRDTKPEKIVRSLLHHMGYRFRVNQRNLPGNPDIVLRKYRTVIFVHGCFWHRHKGCRRASVPKSKTEYWVNKFQRNVVRDKKITEELETLGWKVRVVWECEVGDLTVLLEKVSSWLQPVKAD